MASQASANSATTVHGVAEKPTSRQYLIFIGVTWFLVSALLSMYANSTFLNHFGSPLLLTLVRFIGSAGLGLLANLANTSATRIALADVGSLFREFTLSAFLLLGANYANSVSLQLSGITLTYVVKASIPVATGMFTLDKHKKTIARAEFPAT